jgi:hypothetical protein
VRMQVTSSRSFPSSFSRVISIRLHLTLPIPCRRPARVQQEGLEHPKGVRLIPLFSSSTCMLLGYGC